MCSSFTFEVHVVHVIFVLLMRTPLVSKCIYLRAQPGHVKPVCRIYRCIIKDQLPYRTLRTARPSADGCEIQIWHYIQLTTNYCGKYTSDWSQSSKSAPYDLMAWSLSTHPMSNGCSQTSSLMHCLCVRSYIDINLVITVRCMVLLFQHNHIPILRLRLLLFSNNFLIKFHFI